MTDIGETTQLWFATALMGALLNDEEIVRAFAALILRRLYGAAELAKQQPLRVADQGGSWVVMGSYQEPGMPADTGAWRMRVRKSDCRVEELGHYEPRELSDEVKSALRARKAGPTGHGTNVP